MRYEQGGGSLYYYSVAEENSEVFNISGTSISTETHLPLVTVEIGISIITCTKFFTSSVHFIESFNTFLNDRAAIHISYIALPNDGGDLTPTTTTEMHSTIEVTITNEDTQPTSTTVDPSYLHPLTSNEIYILPPPLTSLYSTFSRPPPPTSSASDCTNGHR